MYQWLVSRGILAAAVDASGKVQPAHCEMGAGVLIWRMSWSPEMFTAGGAGGSEDIRAVVHFFGR